ncbi:LysR family transcriptional regulator [Rhodophyticola sp. CCM32]|uniref:LysR family transcriptional regulator n=1 Tax=Rhodophyticola sp. CCM32 TaxID=2916397 RepID=UPI00107FCB5D|nr:LysR family transcriptional regulator [Rhodophyticola sp. CCM32]QBY01004.1 LysR family transcriptional regulator [Rhodophyticola sp. CCM32]
MNLRHIEIILTIERAGSLRAAARMLGRTQPALTKALRQAEADLGTSIFERGPSGVLVTEHGRVILRRARIIQEELRRMHEEVSQITGEMDGNLNVTVSPLAATKFVPRALHRFRRRFAKVHVQIGGGHEPMAFGPLRNGVVDFVIGPAPQGIRINGLNVTEIVRTPIAVVTGQNSKYATATSLLDLSDAQWVMIGPKERRAIVAARFTNLGLPAPQPLLNSDSVLSILAILADSDMVCTFPALFLDDFETIWQIRRIPIKEKFEPVSIAITHSADRPLTPAGMYFRDCVLAVAEDFAKHSHDP